MAEEIIYQQSTGSYSYPYGTNTAYGSNFLMKQNGTITKIEVEMTAVVSPTSTTLSIYNTTTTEDGVVPTGSPLATKINTSTIETSNTTITYILETPLEVVKNQTYAFAITKDGGATTKINGVTTGISLDYNYIAYNSSSASWLEWTGGEIKFTLYGVLEEEVIPEVQKQTQGTIGSKTINKDYIDKPYIDKNGVAKDVS